MGEFPKRSKSNKTWPWVNQDTPFYFVWGRVGCVVLCWNSSGELDQKKAAQVTMCMLWVYACFDDAMLFPKAETIEDMEFPSLLETKTEIGNLRCEKGVFGLRKRHELRSATTPVSRSWPNGGNMVNMISCCIFPIGAMFSEGICLHVCSPLFFLHLVEFPSYFTTPEMKVLQNIWNLKTTSIYGKELCPTACPVIGHNVIHAILPKNMWDLMVKMCC